MRCIVHALVAVVGLLGAVSPAHAVANHRIEAIQKIVKDGEVVGARVHLLVDPDRFPKFRINVAPHTMVPSTSKQNIGFHGDRDFVYGKVVHRQTLAGARPGFVIKTLAEKTGVSGLQELYVDIPYGGALAAGMKVNLLSAFTAELDGFQPSTNGFMHIYGAWDGPAAALDKNYIITLPGKGSTLPNATETLAP